MTGEPEDRAGDLLARLLTDPSFRAGFRRDPAAACLSFGLDDLAGELTTGSRGFQTLEVRESRSSLAGVMLAAAAEGVHIGDLIDAASGGPAPDYRAAGAVSQALTHVRLRAVDPSQASHGGLGDSAADGLVYDPDDPPPVCPVCIAKRGMGPGYVPCPTCGGPAEPGQVLCSYCAEHGTPAGAARSMEAVGADRPKPQFAALADIAPSPSLAGGVPPVDVRYLSGSNAGGAWHGSEFLVRDAEGAPGPNGNYHAAYDLFAKPEAPIRAPLGGKVVEVRFNPRTSGQIFGGTVKVQTPDGHVWVFRHVSPTGVQVGQSVQPGQLIAKVSAWDGGATHTHIELWKSYPPSNGYRLDNMEDPLPYLRALYGQPGAAAIPPGGIDPAAGGIPAPAAGAPAAGVPAGAPVAGAPVAGAPVAGAPAAGVPAGAGGVDIAHVPNVSIPPDAAQALASPDADPRAAAQIAQLAAKHEIGIASVQVEGDRTTVIIASVDGQPVGQGNVAARDLAQELAATPAQGREVATPWPIRGLRTGDDVADRIELSFGSAPAPAPAVPPAVPQDLGPGRSTAIFQGVPSPAAEAGPGSATLAGQPAVPAPPAAPQAPAPVVAPAPTPVVDPAPAAVPAAGAPAAPVTPVAPPVDPSQPAPQGSTAPPPDAIIDPSGVAGTLTPDQVRGAEAIIRVYEAHGIDPVAGISVALSESGLRPDAVGDGGTSFGLFQLHQGGALGSLSPEQGKDPEINAGVAARAMQKLGAGGRPTEEQVRIQVTGFERPSDPTGRVIKDTSNIPRARAIYQLIKARQGQAPAP